MSIKAKKFLAKSGKWWLWSKKESIAEVMQGYADQTASDWQKLAAIARPQKWLEMYADYQNLLTAQDVAAFWKEQFEIANKERDELKAKLDALNRPRN